MCLSQAPVIVTCPLSFRQEHGGEERVRSFVNGHWSFEEKSELTNDEWRDEDQRRFLGEGMAEAFMSEWAARTQFLPAVLAA